MEVLQEPHCALCGYDLRGSPPHDPCPECGGHGRRAFDDGSLAACDIRWLARLTTGTTLLHNWVQCMAVAGALSFRGMTSIRNVPVLLLAEVLAALLGIFGFWFFTSPDPGQPLTPQRGNRRAYARFAMLVACVLYLGDSVGPAWWGPSIGEVLVVLYNAAMLVGLLWVRDYAAAIAARIPDPRLARTTRVILALAMGVVAVYGVEGVIGVGFNWRNPYLSLISAILGLAHPLVFIALLLAGSWLVQRYRTRLRAATRGGLH